MKYIPDTNFSGRDTLEIITSDDVNGNLPAKSALSFVDIQVTAVNDAPTILDAQTPVELSAIDEDTLAPVGATVSSLFNARFSDSDIGDVLSGIAISLTATDPSKGVWQYSADDGGSWSDVAALSLGNFTLVKSSDMLRFLPEENYHGPATQLGIYLLDSTIGEFNSGSVLTFSEIPQPLLSSYFSTNVVALTQQINAVNDAPIATTADSVNAFEDQAFHFTGDHLIIVSDPDSENLDANVEADVSSVLLTVSHGKLTVDDPNGELIWNNANQVYISGGKDAVNGKLATLQYVADNNYSGADTLSIQVSDGIDNSTKAIAIQVNAVNDAPIFASIPTNFTATEQQIISLDGMSISDVDAGGNDIKVTLTVVDGVIGALDANGNILLDASGNSLWGLKSFDLTGSVDFINGILTGQVGSIKYFNDNDNPATDESLKITVNDLGNTGEGGEQVIEALIPINITAVNDACDRRIANNATFI